MSKTTKFGEDLIQAMTEALVHAKGRDVAGLRITAIDLETVDFKAIRQKLHLTQDEMAAFLWTSPSTWEQGSTAIRRCSNASA